MKFSLILLSLILSVAAWSKNTHLPPAFTFKEGKAVFIDIQHAKYDITYDYQAKVARYEAVLSYHQAQEGHAVFDLIEDPARIRLNGRDILAPVIKTPDNETSVRVLAHKSKAGHHKLTISGSISSVVSFDDRGVRSAFWFTDLNDRMFLERYLPTNLEYDQHEINFNINFVGSPAPQSIYANGEVKWLSPQNAIVSFPSHFTPSSLYFHTVPQNSYAEGNFDFRSVDGRNIPVLIYTAHQDAANLEKWKLRTLQTLTELENDYGPFPHPAVTIFGASPGMGLGGMEYAGATITGFSALAHELFHSYFARGVMPANGNAGWIDEALASWRDDGYPRTMQLTGSSRMGAHPPYTRKTDTAAYSFGSRFIAYLDGKFAQQGGMKPYLRQLIEQKMHKTMVTEEFATSLANYFGVSMERDFNIYIYAQPAEKNMKAGHQHLHFKASAADLENILRK